jgi:hypothetical protein
MPTTTPRELRSSKLAMLLRRERLVTLLRRKRLVQELHKAKLSGKKLSPLLTAMEDSLINARISVPKSDPRAAMDRLLEDMDQRMEDLKKYNPKIKKPEKNIRIVVEDLKIGCEHCLNKPALIHSPVFNKNLCLDCEEKLEIDAGACYIEGW